MSNQPPEVLEEEKTVYNLYLNLQNNCHYILEHKPAKILLLHYYKVLKEEEFEKGNAVSFSNIFLLRNEHTLLAEIDNFVRSKFNKLSQEEIALEFESEVPKDLGQPQPIPVKLSPAVLNINKLFKLNIFQKEVIYCSRRDVDRVLSDDPRVNLIQDFRLFLLKIMYERDLVYFEPYMLERIRRNFKPFEITFYKQRQLRLRAKM